MSKRVFWLYCLGGAFLAVFFLEGCQVVTSNRGLTSQPGIKEGPPAHAPAHGYRRKHSYWYYPSSSVYYDRMKGVYSFPSNGRWVTSSSLPTDIRIDLHEAVSLELDTDRPYLHYKEHRKLHPPKGK